MTKEPSILTIPLAQIDQDHLVRDRMYIDPDDMRSLTQSLRARGQQTPIEVADLGGGRYGLISGGRRIAAFHALHTETGEDRFAHAQCLVRLSADPAQCYLAMVEENEVRADLSFFERARIVVETVRLGVFDNDRTALQALFQTTSRSKRSKIRSFLTVVRALEGHLRFPHALTERQGLHLATQLERNSQAGDTLRAALATVAPETAQAERAAMDQALAQAAVPKQLRGDLVAGSVRIQFSHGRLVLEGREVTPALKTQLITWLRTRI